MSEPAYNDDWRDAGPTELAAFQAALARLSPTPDSINIARLLFHAGQLSAPRRSWAWPCLTSASMMLAAALGCVLLLRPTPEPVERIVTVLVPPEPLPLPREEPSLASTGGTPVPPLGMNDRSHAERYSGDRSYLRLRSEVLARGLDALPQPTPWPVAVPSNDTDTLLDLPRGSREPWLLHLKRSLQSGGPS